MGQALIEGRRFLFGELCKECAPTWRDRWKVALPVRVLHCRSCGRRVPPGHVFLYCVWCSGDFRLTGKDELSIGAAGS